MDNSETSNEESISVEERNVRVFATQMLKSTIFLGTFQERRRVESLQAYRDVIVISETENDLKRSIEVVKQRLRSFYGPDYWIGITGPGSIGTPVGHCLWVDSKDYPLGRYLYKIKGLHFRRKEIILRVKLLRQISDNDIDDNSIMLQNQSMETLLNNLSENLHWENIKNKILEYFIYLFSTVLTVNNIKEALIYVSVLIGTGIILLIKGIKFLMEFCLKFMREASYFVQSCTPVMISVINLIGKTIGGFYLLIVMMWRDRPSHQNRYVPYRAIQMPPNRPRSTVVIREIE